jgi:hypothetical protein
LLLTGCTTLQKKWDKATDDERARIVLSQSQKSLATLFAAGQAFVDLTPKYALEWQTKIKPAFSILNKVLADLIAKGKRGEKLTYVDVVGAVGTKLDELQRLLTAWGVKL